MRRKITMTQIMEYPRVVVGATTLAALLIAGVMFLWQKKKQKAQKYSPKDVEIPSKWTKVGEIGELIMYPLKGAKRKCVTEAEFTKKGLRELNSQNKIALRDRVFVLHNDSNKKECMNTKRNSKMLLINTTSVDESTIKFSFPDTDDLIVQIPENNNILSQFSFCGEILHTVDCGDEAASWFSQRLLNKPTGLRLGCYFDSLVPPRTVEGAWDKYLAAYTKFHSEYMGAYSDIASYMMMGEESLNDLNSRLQNPVTEHNFRPNIVVKGSPAFSEDDWDWVKIGDEVVLRGFKYCTRCVVTTVDPETGKKDPAVEPLRTLKGYRQVTDPEKKKVEGNGPVMGLYLGCHQVGTVRVGDPVYINAE